jgi:hypothetical protein
MYVTNTCLVSIRTNNRFVKLSVKIYINLAALLEAGVAE